MKKLLSILLFVGLISGCATFQEMRARNLATYCQENAAYQAGLNTAKNGGDMDLSYYHQCPAELQNAAMESYKEGYEVGLPNNQTIVITQ